MNFMSIEVAVQLFLFSPVKRRSRADVRRFLNGQERDQSIVRVAFSHNHLHDLESLWWVAVWVVFYNNFSEETPSRDRTPFTSKNAEDQINLAKTLFPSVLKDTDRQNGFSQPDAFLDMCKKLPGNKTVICNGLDVLRNLLVTHYIAIEAGYPLSVDPRSSGDDIYDDFTELFSILKRMSNGLVLDFIPHAYTKLLKEEKAKRTDDSGVAQTNPGK